MLDLNASKVALRNLFHRTPAVEVKTLYRVLKTRIYMNVFRRLTLLGYLSSYTHRGRYYTLREIPQFDKLGLWHYGEIGFYRGGTLKAAVADMVEKSQAGRRHQELQALLRVRVHNELLEHVRAERLGRKRDDGHWLYLSANASRATKQWARRQAQKKRTAVLLGPLTTAMTIEVLGEILKSSRVLVTPEQVVRQLHHQGVTVPLVHVQWVFDRYGLGKKKRGPDSPRLRR